VATVVLGIGISVVLFTYRHEVERLGNLGYLGAFIISLVTSATVFLPAPGLVAIVPLAASLNPVLVGLAAGTGGIIGEITGFMIGYGGSGVVAKEHGKTYRRLEDWMRRWGGWAIFAIAAVPLPLFDVAGIMAGALHYPLRKFFLIGWAAKCVKTVAVVAGGVELWRFLISCSGG
jgi:membrane protein YqaA with SNARE-associated domain